MINKIIGALIIVLGLVFLAFNSVIYIWYFKYFYLKEGEYTGFPLFMALMFIDFFILGFGVYFLTENPIKKQIK